MKRKFKNILASMNAEDYYSQIWAKNQFRILNDKEKQDFVNLLIDIGLWKLIDQLAQSDYIQKYLQS